MKKIVLLGILLIGAMLFACAPKIMTTASVEGKSSEIVALVTKTGWEAEWEKTLAQAKKEGKVVVYGGTTAAGLKEVALRLVKDKFGFDLEVITARGGQLAVKISSERDAGLYISDVYISGLDTTFEVFIPRGWVDKMKPLLILPEVVDPNAWYGGEHPWVDEDRSRIFVIWNSPQLQMVINTNLVKAGEIASYRDLLDAKWRGKILINDPTVAGTAQQNFSGLIYHKALDVNYFRELVKLSPVLSRDERFQIDSVAKGKFAVVLWPTEMVYSGYMAAGASLSGISPKEGVTRSAGGGGLLVMERAPHPNAAKIFVNWFLSKEGQYLLQGATGKRSARVDIPTDNVEPILLIEPGIPLLMVPTLFDKEFRSSGKYKYDELANEIFGPLLK